MQFTVEEIKTKEDRQKFEDNFTIALFEMYVERLEKGSAKNEPSRLHV